MVRADPIIGAAAGAAVFYYGLRAASAHTAFRAPADSVLPILLFLLLVAAAAVTASAVPGRRLRILARFAVASCVGAAVGIAAADRPASRAYWGMPEGGVRSALVRVSEDPRKMKNGGFLAAVSPISAENAGGVRTSASGRLTAFFSPGVPVPERDSMVRVALRVEKGARESVAFVSDASLAGEAVPPERFRFRLRTYVLEKFGSVPWGGLAGALLLGTKDGLDAGEAEAYTASGCAHVLALSGMHLAVLSALLAFLLKPLLGFRGAASGGFFFVLAYVHLAGAQPSLVRAAIMYGTAAVGILLGVPRRPLCSLCLAFLVQLVFVPESAETLSFILSYLALTGILIVGSASDDLLRAWVPDQIRPAFSASLGAFLATAAVSAASFGSLRPVSLVASLLLGPAAGFLMIGSMAWLLAGAAFPTMARVIEAVMHVLWRVNGMVAEAASKVPAVETRSAMPVLFISLAVSLVLVYGRYARNRARNRLEPID